MKQKGHHVPVITLPTGVNPTWHRVEHLYQQLLPHPKLAIDDSAITTISSETSVCLMHWLCKRKEASHLVLKEKRQIVPHGSGYCEKMPYIIPT